MGFDFSRDNPSEEHYYESNETYVHPDYFNNQTTLTHDLALLRMNKPINTSADENSICLPEKWSDDYPLIREQLQYVMFAGWGKPTQHLRMAPKIWLNMRYPNLPVFLYQTEVVKIDNQGACRVSDSLLFHDFKYASTVKYQIKRPAVIRDPGHLG